MLKKLIFLAILLATTIGVSGLINGWPKTAIACGAIVLFLAIIAFVFERVAKKYLRNNGE